MFSTRRIAVTLGVTAIAACLLLCNQREVSAEHFNITLVAESHGDTAMASTDETPPIGGVNPRPVLKTKSGEEIKITWKMASGFPHGTMKQVGVHFFVVRQQALGQKPVPDPAGAGGIIDNYFKIDFAPNTAANGAVRFRAPEAGAYLIRLQSEDTHVEHGHEHFSAIDLSVE